MAQITIYIDEGTLKQVEAAAHKEHDSISKWVKRRLVTSLQNAWPKDYFSIFGSLPRKEKLERPKNLPFTKDIKRQVL